MDSSLRIEHEAAVWLARRDAGDWSNADRAQFDTWLNAAIAHRVAFVRLESAWRQADRVRALGAGVAAGSIPARGDWTLSPFFDREAESADSARAPHGVPPPRRRDPDVPRRSRHRTRFAAFAAGLLLAASLGFLGYRHFAVPETTYATQVGVTESVALSDGSTAILSSDSRVMAAMSPRGRRVDVQRGEAYFDVAKDASRPFVVGAGSYRVIAVGTRFSVRREGDGLRIVVTEGVVRLESGARAQADVRLRAGSVALIGKDGAIVQDLPVDRAEEYLSWRDGLIRFRDTPLGEAVAEFNRYNTRKLVVADAKTAAVLVGGQFRWSNTDAFVRLLRQGFSIRAEERGDEVVLRSE